MADKIQILEALNKLDPTNDSLWTNDGSPVTAAVEKLLGEPVTRAQLVAAAPTFTRDGIVASMVNTFGSTPVEPIAPVAPGFDPVTGVKSAPQISEDEEPSEDLKVAMQSQYENAVRAAEEAGAAVVAAQKRHGDALKARDKALLDMHRKFPPLDAATAIQQHLASEHRKREQAAGIAPSPASQLDRAMGGRKAPHGWNSNVRQRGRVVPSQA